ncbi:MAG: hypothetical protein WB988_03565 [Candidatus Nitrosopolaris sp.]|jgi:hypothetical protein
MKFISTDYYPRKRFVNTASNEEKKQFKKKAKDFRQYDVFNQYAFLKYLKDLQRKFRKLLLFIYSNSTSQFNYDQTEFRRK